MEKYRELLNKKLKALRLFNFIFTIIIVYDLYTFKIVDSVPYSFLLPNTKGTSEFDYINSLIYGTIVILELIYYCYIQVKYYWILKDDTRLKQHYIKEFDERTQSIRSKAGGNTFIFCSILFLLIGIVSAYFNEYISITLLICSLFLLATNKALRTYYLKKY